MSGASRPAHGHRSMLTVTRYRLVHGGSARSGAPRPGRRRLRRDAGPETQGLRAEPAPSVSRDQASGWVLFCDLAQRVIWWERSCHAHHARREHFAPRLGARETRLRYERRRTQATSDDSGRRAQLSVQLLDVSGRRRREPRRGRVLQSSAHTGTVSRLRWWPACNRARLRR